MSTSLYDNLSRQFPTFLDTLEYYKDDPVSQDLIRSYPTSRLEIVPDISLVVDVKRKVLRVAKVYPMGQHIEEYPLDEKRVVPLRRLWSIPRGKWFLAYLTGGVIFRRKGFVKLAVIVVWKGGVSGGAGGF